MSHNEKYSIGLPQSFSFMTLFYIDEKYNLVRRSYDIPKGWNSIERYLIAHRMHLSLDQSEDASHNLPYI